MMMMKRMGGRKRRTMRGGVIPTECSSGGRKRRSMRGGVRPPTCTQCSSGGRKRRTMRGGQCMNPLLCQNM